MKFKVGDIVKANEESNGVYVETTKYNGWHGKIVKIYKSSEGFNAFTLSEHGKGETYYDLHPDCFDLVKSAESQKKIVITTNGRETTARLI